MNDELLDEALRRADPAKQWAMVPETADSLLRELRALDSVGGQSSKGKRRRWIALLLAGATCLGGVSVAAPAVANFMGFLTEDVENAPPVPSSAGDGQVRSSEDIPNSKWINPLAADYAEFAKTKYASLPLPLRYDEERLKNASALEEAQVYRANDQGAGVITQDIAPTTRYETVVRCIWQKEWLDRHDQGDSQGQAAAVSILRQSLTWPATVAADGGGVVEHLTLKVTAAAAGDAERVEEDQRRLGCKEMIEGLEQ